MKNRLLVFLVLFVLSSLVQAKLKLDASGDVQYRIRYNYLLERDALDRDSSRTPDFQNRYAWNFRLKAIPNEFITLGFRLSNPGGYGLDVLDSEVDTIAAKFDESDTAGYFAENLVKHPLSIAEAYFKWTPGIIDLMAGIIPVYSNSVLDLAAYNQKGYKDVGASTWKTKVNESQPGLMLGVNYLESEDLLVRSELLFTMVKDASGSNAFDAFVQDKFRLMLNVPVELKKKSIAFIPTGHFILNNVRSEDNEKASHTIEGGLEVKVQPNEKLSVLLGAAGGLLNNEALEDDSLYVASAPLGMLLKTKIRLVPTYGRIMFEFRYGRSRDREALETVNYDLLHWDLKYAMPIKKLTVMPRVRLWYSFNSLEEHSVLELRPALILKAAF